MSGEGDCLLCGSGPLTEPSPGWLVCEACGTGQRRAPADQPAPVDRMAALAAMLDTDAERDHPEDNYR